MHPLVKSAGLDLQQIEDMMMDVTECYGICKRCGELVVCEPDATANYCEECQTKGTVVSVLVLEGLL